MEPIVTDKWGNPLMPLSIKGIVCEGDSVWLRKNEHGRWELPGGRPDGDEQPDQTVVRELGEELGLSVEVVRLVDAYIMRKDFGSNPIIGIITFECAATGRIGEPELEGEGGEAEFKLFPVDEALKLDNLPDVYKRALMKL